MPVSEGFAFFGEGEFSVEAGRLDICQIADFGKRGKRDL